MKTNGFSKPGQLYFTNRSYDEGFAAAEILAGRVRAHGDLSTLDRINAQEPGLLQLKAGVKWIDLWSLKSTLGTEGHEFPMGIGHELIGLVVCERALLDSASPMNLNCSPA